MNRYPHSLALSIFLMCLSSACSTTDANDEVPDPTPNPTLTLEPTLSSIQTNIFSTGCTDSMCHNSDDPEADLDLTPGNSFSELVNVASDDFPDLLLVKPSDPDSSYLIWKLENNPNIDGQPMPRGMNAVPLSTSRINIIREWITDGALNN